MSDTPVPDPVIPRLIDWAAGHEQIRAMLLTSTRAIPSAAVDDLSDDDVILVVRDVAPFVRDRSWVEAFGEVLVAYWDPFDAEMDVDRDHCGNVIQYADGLKIDFTLWTVSHLTTVVEREALPVELDAGYRVLLDRDDLTAGLRAPTFAAYRPVRPDEAAFQTAINDFFSDVPYVAKCVRRGDLFPLKWALDFDMKHVYLRPMLEWWVGCAEGWSAPVGSLGKGLRHRLPDDIWWELEASYADGGMAENAEALFRTVGLYRRVAMDVGRQLGYAYPIELDERVTAYARRVIANVANLSTG